MKELISERVSTYFCEEETLDLLKKLVGIPSHKGVPNQETEVAKTIYDFFLKENIEAELFPVTDGRCNIIARMRGTGTGKSLLFTGHTDTVPPYGMKGNPYDAKILDGKMFGRGVVDMKAGLVCMMMAMAAIKRSGTELSGDLIFAGVIDEEAKSEGTRWYLRNQEIPSAAIVSEPTDMQICIGHRGLEWLEFRFLGKAVHGGKQQEGINAIQKVTDFINRVESNLLPKLKERNHPIIGNSSMNYGFIKGGTQPSTVAGTCILQIDRRWIPSEKYEDVLDEYQQLLDELSAEDETFKGTFTIMDSSYMEDSYIHQAMYTEPDEIIVTVAEQALQKVMGKSSPLGSFPAWTDGGLISYYGKIPTIVLGPGELESAHAENEHIEISSIVPAILVYVTIALSYCK